MASTPPTGFKRLPDSERKLPASAHIVGPVNPDEHLEVSVYLRAPAGERAGDNASQYAQQPGPRMSRQEYAARYSASPDDLAKIEAFAQAHNLKVVEEDPASRRIVLAGTAAAMMQAFAVELQRYAYKGGVFRGRVGHLHLPTELEPLVAGVFGLDDRPQAQPRFRYGNSTTRFPLANTDTVSYTPPQLAKLYEFPQGLDGSGECIALIELGGGYSEQDLATYFKQLGIPTPQVTTVSVDGGENKPEGDPRGADAEVDLDIEIAGAIAPKARIVVYFAPNTDRGFLDAITQALHDTTNNPSVISISWGAPESSWTSQAMQAMDQAFQTAATLGITICCAAGDNGSGDGASDQLAHVDFPASSGYVLGCGGTRLSSSNGKITAEVVWNDTTAGGGATGGGVSENFALPSWQTDAHVPLSINNQHAGRGVPDVAGNADPQTGYQIYVDGQSTVIGGTSAVAPLWAGLIALINQKRGQAIGFLNPFLYKNYQQLTQNKALYDVTSGNNGAYTAGTGWDACTGLGTPVGTQLLNTLITSQS
ncbi:peptidase S53 [Ktedonosporobacter rubrisoli]|uniref:Peptidase S53 n=1 Tax=Ktedonosporobacter rubrisoli TaxID=2509675 RepID=A0A4P6JQF3_KTERU|nr:S53 family peptidase [Ktedonosporobacter rubrisoli]QBD77400.1 peptidase S53 [Ktedonosporobacter rubrisoli]